MCDCAKPVPKDFESDKNNFNILVESKSRQQGLATYSVMPANEASGTGGRSYGLMALHLPRFHALKRFMCIYIYIYMYICMALRIL